MGRVGGIDGSDPGNAMKRFLSIVAVAVAAVLAAQPALAGLTCGMLTAPSHHCADHCDQAKSRLGMDCPMPPDVAGTGCLQDSCQHGFPQGVVRTASGERPKAEGNLFLVPTPFTSQSLSPLSSALAPDALVTAAPDRQVLLRVFRI
jgi:hypothetical protein